MSAPDRFDEMAMTDARIQELRLRYGDSNPLLTSCLDEIERLRSALQAEAIDLFVELGDDDTETVDVSGVIFRVTRNEAGELTATEVVP